MLEVSQNRPLYSIGVISELLGAHPETIRAWERSGVVRPPYRRGGKRVFSGTDLKRLQFVQKLVKEGLTLRAILYYLRLYPCWKTDDCLGSTHCADQHGYAKPCWQEPGNYCQVTGQEDPCTTCEHRDHLDLSDERRVLEDIPEECEETSPNIHSGTNR